MGAVILKILFLTFYYKPDLCAGSFRSTPLVEELHRVMPEGSSIDVVTTLPNRYSSFTQDAVEKECRAALTIHRIAVTGHKSGMVDQSRTFLFFCREVFKLVQEREYDLVFATSSRLMTAVLGALIARKKKARLYLDVRDIFVDTIGDVLPRSMSLLLKPLFSIIEKRTINRADKVNLVSRGFHSYFTSRYPRQSFSYFTNGIDDEFLAPVEPSPPRSVDEPLSVLYAGNLGEGQGLHAIVPELASRMEGRVNFTIIGDGGRKRELESMLAKNKVQNVALLPPVNREQLLRAYRDADVLFLHLNDYDAFKKVLPSKVFEYAALGKPLWAGVSGYAAEFIASEVPNSAVFPPCDVAGAVESFATLSIRDLAREEFVAKYARTSISRYLAEDILATGKR